MIDAGFIINAVLFGAALAMDAFSVSLTNGMTCPCMRPRRMLLIAGTFATFQALMPLIGWFLVTRLIGIFNVLSPAFTFTRRMLKALDASTVILISLPLFTAFAVRATLLSMP